MKISLLGILILLMGTTFAQPLIQWQNTIGGSSEDYLNAIDQTSDGGFILGGWSNSNISFDKTEATNGGFDYWVVKLDAAGNIEWQNTIGGSGSDKLYSLRQTSDGGYILGGTSGSDISGDKSENRVGPATTDYWVVKLDASGNIVWENTIGGSSTEELKSVRQTSDGGYILGGWSHSDISGDKTEDNIVEFSADYWIVKLDASGNIEWQNTIGGSASDELTSLEITSDGGYIAGGQSWSEISGDKNDSHRGEEDYWIVKISSTGSIEWEKTIGGANEDFLRSVQQSTDGGYIAAGSSGSDISFDKTEATLGDEDYWVIKLDASGNIVWQKSYGGAGSDDLYSIAVATGGGYIIGGESTSDISAQKTENTIGTGVRSDYWIVKIDNSGTLVWENTIGGDKFDYCREVINSDDQGYVAAGYSDSPASADKNEGIMGAPSYWVIKLLPDVCVEPSGLFADNITPSKATVHWNAITGADTYQIWYRVSGTLTWIKKSTAVNFKTLKSLSPGTMYEYQVRTKCSDGEFSDFSEIQTFSTLTLRDAGLTDNSIVQVYPNPAANELFVELYREDATAVVTITNMMGQQTEAFSYAADHDLIRIDISSLAAGIYILNVSDGNSSSFARFVKN